MSSTRNTRNARRLPWVTKLKRSQACQHPKGVPSAKAIREDRVRMCMNPAWWHFKALQRSFPRSGNYCWSHLIYGAMYGDKLEEMRADTWFAKHGVVD